VSATSPVTVFDALFAESLDEPEEPDVPEEPDESDDPDESSDPEDPVVPDDPDDPEEPVIGAVFADEITDEPALRLPSPVDVL
jgi:hypothetical protein